MCAAIMYAHSYLSPSMRREWIEMRYVDYISLGKHKSPSMRREWIEITSFWKACKPTLRLPPCGGSGLKCLCPGGSTRQLSLPPCGGSGLKYLPGEGVNKSVSLPPCGGSGLKCSHRSDHSTDHRLPPCGGSGLKYGTGDSLSGELHVSLHAEGVD